MSVSTSMPTGPSDSISQTEPLAAVAKPGASDFSKAAPPACASQPDAGSGSSTFPPPHLTCFCRRQSLAPSTYLRASALLFCPLPLPILDLSDTRCPWMSHRPPGVLSRFPSLLGHRESSQNATSSAAPPPAQPRVPPGGTQRPSGSRLLVTARMVLGSSPLSHLHGPWDLATQTQNHTYSESNIYIVL